MTHILKVEKAVNNIHKSLVFYYLEDILFLGTWPACAKMIRPEGDPVSSTASVIIR